MNTAFFVIVGTLLVTSAVGIGFALNRTSKTVRETESDGNTDHPLSEERAEINARWDATTESLAESNRQMRANRMGQE